MNKSPFCGARTQRVVNSQHLEYDQELYHTKPSSSILSQVKNRPCEQDRPHFESPSYIGTPLTLSSKHNPSKVCDAIKCGIGTSSEPLVKSTEWRSVSVHVPLITRVAALLVFYSLQNTFFSAGSRRRAVSDSPTMAPASGAKTSKVIPFITSSNAVWFFNLHPTK